MSPRRIQRQRTKGWRMPEGAVYVGRPSPWGNPFPVSPGWMTWVSVALGYRADSAGRRDAAVALYRAWISGEMVREGSAGEGDEQSVLEYSDGSTGTIDEHVRGWAAFAARMETAPTLPVATPDLEPLRGRDLVCWCPLDQPCHADVLLELASR